MILEHFSTDNVTGEYHYAFEARDNIPYLVLMSVHFTCHVCDRETSISMKEVPVHQVQIRCGACDKPLFVITEDDFEHELEVAEKGKIWVYSGGQVSSLSV